jgi:aspartate/glutamate racemase
MKKVVLIHTSLVSILDLKALFAEMMPEVRMVNIIDDSLLPEVMEHGGVTPSVVRRICAYAVEAEAMGADLIFNQCSSVGEAFDIASRLVHVPTLKIDQAMAEKAVDIGQRILTVATVETTLGPSCRLIESVAREKGKSIELQPCLVKGAFAALTQEADKEKHNRLILDAIRENAESADVVVLAQGSMTALLPYLSDIPKPVLTSPRLGVERARKILK